MFIVFVLIFLDLFKDLLQVVWHLMRITRADTVSLGNTLSLFIRFSYVLCSFILCFCASLLFSLLGLCFLVLLDTFLDQIGLCFLKALSDTITFGNLVGKVVKVSVNPNIANASREDVVQPVERLYSQPLSRNTADKHGGCRSADTVLWRCEIGLSDADVASKFGVDDIQNPDDGEDSQYQVGPSALCVDSGDVSPAQLIRAYCAVRATVSVDGQKYRKNDNRKGYEYLQQHTQEAQEEIGVKTTFLNKGLVGCSEERYSPLPYTLGRSWDSFTFSNEI